MDVYFLVDLALNFFVGYFDDGEFIVKKHPIAVRYLKSWFFIDFFSSVSTLLQVLATTRSLAFLRNLKVRCLILRLSHEVQHYTRHR